MDYIDGTRVEQRELIAGESNLLLRLCFRNIVSSLVVAKGFHYSPLFPFLLDLSFSRTPFQSF